MPISVSIVEDDPEVRNALIRLIESSDDLIFSQAFSSAEKCMLNFEDRNDNVVIMDIQLPGSSGIEAVKKMKPKYPDTQFMMFTVFEDEDMIFDALCAGASGYILKNSTSVKIVDAIKDLHSGGSPMSAQIARKVVQSFKKNSDSKSTTENLTSRENEILEHLSKGFRYKEIAAILFISVETVRTHIRNIYQKLEVQSRTDALNKVFPRR